MNYVETMGGLGNQIFQYVFSKYLMEKTGKTCVLHMNFFDYVKNVPGATVRVPDLDKFHTVYVSVNGAIKCEAVVNEEELRDENTALQDGVFYRGYWQDLRYFDTVRDSALKELVLKDEYISDDMRELAGRMADSESVSLHIRGTDYLKGQNRNIFAAQGAEYYRKALEMIAEKMGRELCIFVFTDDHGHAEGILDGIGFDAEYMPAHTAYQDLWLMSRAKHHVIANSSYSWWGATLGENQNAEGITVAPASWFKDRTSPSLYPDEWIVL